MNYIEFIGPQGIGKSALLRKLMKEREQEVSWRTYHEAICELSDSLKWNQLKGIKCRMLFLINKLNFTRYKKIGISNALINEYKVNFPDTIKDKYDYLINAQFKYLSSMDFGISSLKKASLLNWHINSLNKLFLLELYGYKKTVVFDEGPIKTHYGLSAISVDSIEKDTLPKAVVYCYLDLHENLKRIYARKEKTGNMSVIHSGWDNEELVNVVKMIDRRAKNNIEILRSYNIPILDIDMIKVYDSKNIDIINKFLNKYSNNYK